MGVALLAALADGSRAEGDTGAVAAFLVSLKDQAIEQVIYLVFTLEFLAEEANDLGSPYQTRRRLDRKQGRRGP